MDDRERDFSKWKRALRLNGRSQRMIAKVLIGLAFNAVPVLRAVPEVLQSTLEDLSW